jgi:hypothetical protein
LSAKCSAIGSDAKSSRSIILICLWSEPSFNNQVAGRVEIQYAHQQQPPMEYPYLQIGTAKVKSSAPFSGTNWLCKFPRYCAKFRDRNVNTERTQCSANLLKILRNASSPSWGPRKAYLVDILSSFKCLESATRLPSRRLHASSRPFSSPNDNSSYTDCKQNADHRKAPLGYAACAVPS